MCRGKYGASPAGSCPRKQSFRPERSEKRRSFPHLRGGIHPAGPMAMAVPGGEVELALDLGKVTGSGREAPICEVEIEGKTGEASQWEVFARDFAEKFGLHPQPKSKFRRALALTLEEK